ncbi:G-protein coupled receptor 1 isoform X2 [Panicum hallii]|uniref:G-protein coupled receptor 1 isoform X2 n=1 Tax=Panicum hallii TaxID=206008 RepID=UPI000DF4D727|nr:G-protein coupled receptor 1 isoform X2 [Panicum hallii]
MAPAVAAAASAAVSQALRERQILDAVGTGAAALSLVGSSFIVLCYLLFRELRKFSFKLVFYLAVSDMFCSLFTILGGPSNAFYCFAHDYSAHFFCVASFLWTTTIAFTLHRTVVKHKTDVEEFGSIFHLYVWGTSLATTVLRSIGSDYGRPGSWCWIQQGSMAKVLHLITFYLPLWGAILYNGFTYYEVNRMLNNATRMAAGISDRSNQSDIRADRKSSMGSHTLTSTTPSSSTACCPPSSTLVTPGQRRTFSPCPCTSFGYNLRSSPPTNQPPDTGPPQGAWLFSPFLIAPLHCYLCHLLPNIANFSFPIALLYC